MPFMPCIRSMWAKEQCISLSSLSLPLLISWQKLFFCYCTNFSFLAFHDALIYISLWDVSIRLFARIFWCCCSCCIFSRFLFSRESYGKVVKHTYTEEIRSNTFIDQRESEICFIALNNQRIFSKMIFGERKNKKKVVRFVLAIKRKFGESHLQYGSFKSIAKKFKKKNIIILR